MGFKDKLSRFAGKAKSKVKEKTKNVGKAVTDDFKREYNDKSRDFKKVKRSTANKLAEFTGMKHMTGKEFVLTREGRLFFAIFAKILLMALIVLSFGELVFGCVTYFILNKNHKLIEEHYNVSTLPTNMAIAFCVLFPYALMAFYTLQKYENSEYIKENAEARGIRERGSLITAKFWICIFEYLSYAICLYMIYIMFIFSFDLSSMKRIAGEGIKSSMNKYLHDNDLKTEIDNLQWYGSCCGADGYDDWKSVPLINFENAEMKNWYLNLIGIDANRNISLVTDEHRFDVPYSCCRADVKSSCLKFDVLNSHNAYSILPHTTFNNNGCKALVENWISRLSKVMMWYHYAEMIMCFICLIVFKLINASLISQFDTGNEENVSPVVQFPINICLIMIAFIVWFFFWF